MSHAFDYTDTGGANVSIVGSGLGGDIIALGAGNDTVQEPTGDNIIFVKNAATAGNATIVTGSGNNTIYVGHGVDSITAGSGINTIVYSGTRSQYQVTRLASGALQIADQRTGAPNGIDTVSNGSYFQFSDGTYTFAPPLVSASNLTAAHNQSYAPSSLFRGR